MTRSSTPQLKIHVLSKPMTLSWKGNVLLRLEGAKACQVFRYLVESLGRDLTIDDLAQFFDTTNPPENAAKQLRHIRNLIWGEASGSRTYEFDESLSHEGETLLRFKKNYKSSGISLYINLENPRVYVDIFHSNEQQKSNPTTARDFAGPQLLLKHTEVARATLGRKPVTTDVYRERILKSLAFKYFPNTSITDAFLSHDIRSMDFRGEWQFLVNHLVSETHTCLRAMVFDTELTKWWTSLPGQVYMATNIELLKKNISIKRIFVINSLDARTRRHALQQAYLHNLLGVDVRVCERLDIRGEMPYKADMISIHDDMFCALYYFTFDADIVNILLHKNHVIETRGFYDEVFKDDRLCQTITKLIEHLNPSKDCIREVEGQLAFLKRIASTQSKGELLFQLNKDFHEE